MSGPMQRATALAEAGRAYIEQMRGSELSHNEVASLFDMLIEEIASARNDQIQAAAAAASSESERPALAAVATVAAVFEEIVTSIDWLRADLQAKLCREGSPMLFTLMSALGQIGYMADQARALITREHGAAADSWLSQEAALAMTRLRSTMAQDQGER